MNRNAWIRGTLFVFGMCIACFVNQGSTQEAPQVRESQPVLQQDQTPPVTQEQQTGMPQGNLDTAGRFKLSLSAEYGVGFKRTTIGTTTSGEAIKISGGGGGGGAVRAGYGISKRFDLDFDLGFQGSVLEPAVSNATGVFSRGYLLATLKYKVPTSDNGQFKYGLGIGEYFGGELDVDAASIPGGHHDIVQYKPATGVQGTMEFERFIRPTVSFHLGGKIYFVKYKADSWKQDGVTQPVAGLRDEIRNFDGGGFDVMIGISRYF